MFNIKFDDSSQYDVLMELSFVPGFNNTYFGANIDGEYIIYTMSNETFVGMINGCSSCHYVINAYIS